MQSTQTAGARLTNVHTCRVQVQDTSEPRLPEAAKALTKTDRHVMGAAVFPYSAVGLIYFSQPAQPGYYQYAACSGSLIAPNVVLTVR